MAHHNEVPGAAEARSNNVKDTVDIESGRFEFFKQMLTIGLGGIAGLAAIFTDPDKIPDEFWRMATLTVFAIAAIVVVLFASMGISSYANHLRDVEKLSHKPDDTALQLARTRSERGILFHAQVTLAASWIGAASLVGFAALMLFDPSAIGAEAALKAAKKIVEELPGHASVQTLDRFQTVGDDYLVTYVTSPGQVKYAIRVKRNTNSIVEIAKP